MEQGKLIVLDWNVFVFTSIFAWRKYKNMPFSYLLLNSIITCIRKIGLEPQDTVYLATDFLKSWRKQYAEEYKANRKELRESYEDIDWKKTFNTANELLNNLNKGTEFIVVKGEHLEADDIASYIVRHNKDKEIVLVTIDSDWEILWSVNNKVKIFSPKMKPKRYKIKPKKYNPALELAKKIKCERADNLISEIKTEEDYEVRKMLVDLINLPDFIEKQIEDIFSNIEEKENININCVPYAGLREKIGNLYNEKDAIVTYEWTEQFEERKKKRLAKKRKVKK